MVLQTFVPYCVFFLCVCMCMSQTQKKRKLQAGEVMCETRFMRICVLKERREKERNVKNKWEKKKKNAAKVFGTRNQFPSSQKDPSILRSHCQVM